jgi:hypothetical protein
MNIGPYIRGRLTWAERHKRMEAIRPYKFGQKPGTLDPAFATVLYVGLGCALAIGAVMAISSAFNTPVGPA